MNRKTLVELRRMAPPPLRREVLSPRSWEPDCADREVRAPRLSALLSILLALLIVLATAIAAIVTFNERRQSSADVIERRADHSHLDPTP